MTKPSHIAFIMDGNRRWARQRGLPISVGHTKGVNRVEDIVEHAIKLKIPFVTFWAFSTENWNREEQEVTLLMEIFRKFFSGPIIKKLKKNKVKIIVLGELGRFPEDIQKMLVDLIDDTKQNTAITVNIALNYGGRAEILRAVKQILAEKAKELDEKTFNHYLYTTDQPDPDLIIRTGGEQRLSGFLPWQGVYSELYFPDVYWPDFDEHQFDIALEEFASRERRFGK